MNEDGRLMPAVFFIGVSIAFGLAAGPAGRGTSSESLGDLLPESFGDELPAAVSGVANLIEESRVESAVEEFPIVPAALLRFPLEMGEVRRIPGDNAIARPAVLA